jgi:hypothetical protein
MDQVVVLKPVESGAGILNPQVPSPYGAEENPMAHEHSLWRAIRWPLVVVLVGLAGVATATILDELYANEWSLTIGAPSLGLFLPIGAVWLIVAVITHLKHNRQTS